MSSSNTLTPPPNTLQASHPFDTDAQFSHALALHQGGQLASAQAIYEAILQVDPTHANSWHMLGVVALQSDQPQRAVDCIGSAIRLQPTQAGFYLNHGNALRAQQQNEAALASFDRAIALQPNFAEAYSARGSTQNALNQLQAAVASFAQSLALQPGNMVDWYHHGNTLMALQQFAPAIASYDRVIAIDSSCAPAYANRGVAQQSLQQLEAAIASYDQAIAIQPDYAQAHFNRGSALQALHRLEEAIASYDQAIAIDPHYAQAYCNRGCIQKDLQQTAAAVASYDQAIAIQPDYADAWANRGIALDMLRQVEQAEHSYRRALEIDPTLAEAHHNLALSLLTRGNIPAATQGFRSALATDPHRNDAHSALLLCLSSDINVDAATLFAAHVRFGTQLESPLRPLWQPHANVKDPGRTLNIGFVSGDLYSHAVATFIEPVLQGLSKNPTLKLHAYYNHTVQDAINQRLHTYFSRWNDVAKLSDADLAQKIRADQIDILIDLSGHTGMNRLATFAHKPAPIQATWIGFPSTTGLQSMDYFLADHHFLPHSEFAHQFTEKLLYLPAAALFLPFEGAPPVNALPALTNGYLTFGSFNKLKKFSPAVVALWARVLRAHPNSPMVLGGMETNDHATVLQWFADEGIASNRLRFFPVSGMPTYLGLHHQVDICLDTFPYNGGTTTLHALWMGVPTLTLSGATPPTRAGHSLLGHVNLPTCQARTHEEFVALSLAWADNLDELALVRASLRNRLSSSAFGQPKVMCEALEQALRTMWQRWCQKLPAESFSVV